MQNIWKHTTSAQNNAPEDNGYNGRQEGCRLYTESMEICDSLVGVADHCDPLPEGQKPLPLLETIKSGEPIPDEIFMVMFEIEDIVERTKFIEAARERAREQRKLTEFNTLFKAWQAKNLHNRPNAGNLAETMGNLTEFTDAPVTLFCGSWKADDSGVYRVEPVDSTYNGGYSSQMRMVCPHPILPVERLVNVENHTEKLRLAYKRDNQWKDITVDCTTCFNKQHITALGDRGIFVTSETARDLVRYLSDMVRLNMNDTAETKALPVSKSISRLGWVDGGFVPYMEDMRYDGDSKFMDMYQAVCTKGDRDTWFAMAGELRKNMIVRLMMAASLASPLIEKAGALPFVFHLWGTTSFGKTVLLMVGLSIWGNPENGALMRSLDATKNSMARTAAFLYNLPLGADELQQIKNRWESFDTLIMRLTEGIDRGRARADGGIEELRTWRNCFLFTGEQPITQDNSGGGTKNRVIEVEVTQPIFSDKTKSGNEVANTVREHYGFAGKEFIDYVKDVPSAEMRIRLQLYVDEIMKNCDTTDKQAHSMGLILLADHFACQCLFPDEEPLTVEDIKPFLHQSKTVDAAERAYEWCMNWVAKNSNRFVASANDVYGKMDTDHVWIVKDVLIQAMHDAGFDFTAINRKWAEKGYLVKNSQGRNVHRTSVNGVVTNCVKLALLENEQILSGVEVDELPPEEFLTA